MLGTSYKALNRTQMTQDWIHSARSLPIGSKRKVDCCSADPSATISNGHKGVSFFCHRCGHKDWAFHADRSLAEILATQEVLTDMSRRPPVMPRDAVTLAEGPQAGWVWVLAGGLTPEDASGLYGMRWHEPSRRVLIPIHDAKGKLVAILGRGVHGERPKYRMIAGKADSFFRTPLKPSRRTVAVEDVLSAIAVGRAGVNAVAVLGTAITPEHAAELARGADEVIGWFDGDAAGFKAWERLRKRMRLHPVKCTRIQTEQDPKALHRQALRELLNKGA